MDIDLTRDELPSASQPALRDLLRRDHARLERVFAELIGAFQANADAEVTRLWTKLNAAVEQHFTQEERHILPAFAKVEPVQAEFLAREHAVLRAQLLRLGVGVDLHITRLEAAEDFVISLRAHAEREDTLLYDWADQHLDESAYSALTAESFASTLANA
jgi:hypothetical protein